MSKLISGLSPMHRIDWKLLRTRPSAEEVYEILTPPVTRLAESEYLTARSVLRNGSETHQKEAGWALTREVVLEAGESYNHPLSSGLTEYHHGAFWGQAQGTQSIPQASHLLVYFFIG